MSTRELVFTLIWTVVHSVGFSFLLSFIPGIEKYDETLLSLYIYGASTVVLCIVCFNFLKNDFNTLCDNFRKFILEFLRAYAIIIAFDLLLAGVLSLAENFGANVEIQNENNQAINGLIDQNMNIMKAVSVFLAPICEEIMFRGAIFGGIRKKNRFIAYAISMLLFSVYHVWAFAIQDPTYWVYILQYLPVSFVLCNCYERSNTIWTPIAFHMSWNAVTFNIMSTM